MPIFPVPSGPFAGMTQVQLQAARDQARQALIDLTTGGKPVKVAYAQGNGMRSVDYAVADEARLRALLRQLNDALGVSSGRRALAVRFR
jgi:hypothetical protein